MERAEIGNRKTLLRYEGVMEGDWKRKTKELPICLLHRFKLFVGYLHARRRVRSARNPRHLNGRIRKVVIVLEDWLVSGVPVSHLTAHVSARNDVNLKNLKQFKADHLPRLTHRRARILPEDRRT